MVFNFLAKNNDDHTKNISFLMDETGKCYAERHQGGGGTRWNPQYPRIIDQVEMPCKLGQTCEELRRLRIFAGAARMKNISFVVV